MPYFIDNNGGCVIDMKGPALLLFKDENLFDGLKKSIGSEVLRSRFDLIFLLIFWLTAFSFPYFKLVLGLTLSSAKVLLVVIAATSKLEFFLIRFKGVISDSSSLVSIPLRKNRENYNQVIKKL